MGGRFALESFSEYKSPLWLRALRFLIYLVGIGLLKYTKVSWVLVVPVSIATAVGVSYVAYHYERAAYTNLKQSLKRREN